MLAARDGYSKVINLLVSHGADINVQDGKGYTVCHGFFFLSVIAGLLSAYTTFCAIPDASIFCQALCIAVQYGREEAVLKLLHLGADKTIRTKAGKNPADLAVMFKHPQVPEFRYHVSVI